MTFDDILQLTFKNYKANWRWLIVSIISFVLLGIYRICTEDTIYERSITVLLTSKDSEKGSPKSSIDILQSPMAYDIGNELAYALSPKSISGVIKTLNLNVQYSLKGFLRDSVLYGDNLPIWVDFIDETPPVISFDISLKEDERIELYNIVVPDQKRNNSIICKYGDTINISLASMRIIRNNMYVGDIVKNPIHIKCESTESVIKNISSNISTVFPNKFATVMNLNYRDSNKQRADDVIMTLFKTFQEYRSNKARIANQTKSDSLKNRIAIVEDELKYLYKECQNNNRDYNTSIIKANEGLLTYLLEKREDEELKKSEEAFELQLLMTPDMCGKDLPVAPNKKRTLFLCLFMGCILPFTFLCLKNIILMKNE